MNLYMVCMQGKSSGCCACRSSLPPAVDFVVVGDSGEVRSPCLVFKVKAEIGMQRCIISAIPI
jgi:hypothetical protein